MEKEFVSKLVQGQRDFFKRGESLCVDYRIRALKRLKAAVIKYEGEINAALKADLGKSAEESYMCEVGMVLSELSYMISHTKRFAKEKRVLSPLAQFAARSFIKPSPYGVTLIISPWNYPFMLTLEPLANALAAGNTAVLKPSAYSPNVSAVLLKIISECFNPEYVAVITGGRAENEHLLCERFDYIFFTGSQAVGKYVMACAARFLTPVTLELGGKSPCIVDKTAKLKLAAKRIVFGKYLNCGQTCVAPDYVYCHKDVKEQFIKEVKAQIQSQYSNRPLENPNYGKMINRKHFDRVCGLIDGKKVVCGGQVNPDTLKIAPTVMDNVGFDDKVMQEEIFGPVLPIITFTDTGAVINEINDNPSPLALYVFSEDKKTVRRVIERCSFGGGCINDTIIHLATSRMGFGGVGESGMGAYHGKVGFETFSHKKSIVDKKTFIDLPMRYQPYKKLATKLIRMFLK